ARITGYVKIRAQAETGSHRWVPRVGEARGLVPRWPDVRALGLRCCETDGMSDFARQDLVVADKAREDWQAGGVGRCPGRRAQSIGQQVEDGARVRTPTGSLWVRVVHLIEEAVIHIYRDDVPIARTGTATLDRGVQRNGVGARIAFAGIVKRRRIQGLG